MATAGEITVDANEALGSLTLHVRVVGLLKMRARLKLGMLFIRMGSWITGSNLVIDGPDKEK